MSRSLASRLSLKVTAPLVLAAKRCAKVPADMRVQVEEALRAASSARQSLIATIDKLLDGLDRLLLDEGFGV